MPLVPAKCRDCGLVFRAAGGISVSNVSGLALRGNIYRPCPRCGGTADFLEGTFDVGAEFFKVIQAPESSIEMLRELRLLLIQSRDAAEPPEATIKRVEAASPEFAKTLRRFADDHPELFTRILVALIGLLAAIVAGDKVQVNISVSAFNTFVTNILPISAHDRAKERKSPKDSHAPEDRPKH